MINTIKFERRKLICRKSVNENKFDPKMKIVVLYILLFSVLCYCEDEPTERPDNITQLETNLTELGFVPHMSIINVRPNRRKEPKREK
ncbi:hypothetical protein JTB14_023102 [Gonioctena quinquepunctata]|nr:hypothetical protein JTB14_023102 [Gonioctena quinquepunctata]